MCLLFYIKSLIREGDITNKRQNGYNLRQGSSQDDIFITQNAVKNFEPKSTRGDTITNDTLYFGKC